MISLYKIENPKTKVDGDYVSVELRGLSTDTKPTEIAGKQIDNGSVYIELDTGTVYLYDLENQIWNEV